VRTGNTALRDAISKEQAALMTDGTVSVLIKHWLGTGATMPS
jgi:hypothetical protein